MADEPVTPEVVDDEESGTFDGSRLMRIAAMTRAMLDEARATSLDEAGRRRLSSIYDKSLAALADVLPGELKKELAGVLVQIDTEEVPSSSELRMAQAQIVGWLDGLFNGIHAAIASQQLAATARLEQMRRPQGALGPAGSDGDTFRPGTYL